jgi:hypothetical protein
VIDEVCDGTLPAKAAQSAPESADRLPPACTPRFTLFAAIGAASLGVILVHSTRRACCCRRPLAAASISALPLPVVWIFNQARWIADHGSPASSQASTAAPSMGKRALTLENCPKNGSSMHTPTQSGPAKRLMMPATPTVRLPMLLSSRIVWASRPPSVNTLATPRVVPRSKPRITLWPNHGGFAWFSNGNEWQLAARC